MDRREFLHTGAAGVALSAAGGRAAWAAGREAAPRRPDRLRLVRQGRPVPPDPGRARRGRLALRRRPEDARRGRRDRRRPPGLEEDPADLRRLPEMLEEKDLDIVLVATPDHWHALPMIAAVEAGADVYVQKPISVDVAEGQAMLAAAREARPGRPGRHPAPEHAAPDRGPRPHHPRGEARQDRPRRDLLLLPHAGRRQPARHRPARVARLRDVDRPGADAALQLACVHPRGWRAFTEYSNGIVGDMCIHMLDMVRWMLGLGWPKRVASTGGILVDKESKANIPDTQTATFDFGDLNVVWQHRTWGEAGRPEVSLGRDLLRRQGDAQGQRQRLRLHPARRRQADPRRCRATSWTSTPRTRPRRTWRSTSPRRSAATCGTSSRPSPRAASPWPTSRRGTSPPRAASWPTCP